MSDSDANKVMDKIALIFLFIALAVYGGVITVHGLNDGEEIKGSDPWKITETMETSEKEDEPPLAKPQKLPTVSQEKIDGVKAGAAALDSAWGKEAFDTATAQSQIQSNGKKIRKEISG